MEGGPQLAHAKMLKAFQKGMFILLASERKEHVLYLLILGGVCTFFITCKAVLGSLSFNQKKKEKRIVLDSCFLVRFGFLSGE